MEEIFIKDKILNLSDLGNVIPKGYNYYKKKITPGLQLNLPDACLKWYELHPPDIKITDNQVQGTKAFIEAETKTGRLKLENELEFVILHRAGDYLLLLITTWRNTNEMWESIYFKKADQFENYVPMKFNNDHKGTYCVWELGIVLHERNAWVRFIESKRDEKAKIEYLNNLFSGEV